MCKILIRLKEFIDYQGIPTASFERSVGMSNGAFGKQLKAHGAIGTDKLENILLRYPDLSPTWLLTGDGEMFKSHNTPNTKHVNERLIEENHQHKDSNVEVETRPRIPMEAAAGSLSVLTQSVDQSQCDQMPVIASIPDYDFTIMVKGDSMVPEFKSGDEIACRLIRESAFIQWGQPYVVDSYNGIVLKRIHDNGDSIKCTSDNPQYGAFYIPKSEIYRLALVVGLVRLY